MDMKFDKTGKWMLIIFLCLLVSSSSEAAQETQITTPLQPTGGIINSPTKLQGNQNQPILGQPSSSSPVNQPLTGVNQPITGFNQPESTGINQPILGQPSSSSSSLNQPLTGSNQPLPGFNQPASIGQNQPILGQPTSSSSVNQPLTGFNQQSSSGFNQASSSSAQNQQPFTNRLNQNNLSGVPFTNANSKLKVFGTKIVFIWISIFLALHGTDRN
ncbi:PREDICTED: protein PF14_0175 [Camelina sativa]|uniref:Protein PF14_0175 n=1 Tax=Camelina sativa TaxID=90675 RepID=A0ABM0WZR3_CAMSA|nr:PREDICTED: protein PF14_0175 [Camelina sativa]